jgi:hypothetical protein
MNHRLDNDPQHAHRIASPAHRARPQLASTKRRARRSFTVIGALAAASIAVPTALAVSGTARSTPTSTTSTTSAATGCVSTVNGIPPRGSAYVGVAAGGTESVPALQARVSSPLREHRTYFTASEVPAAIRVVKDDLANRRLPWISFKAPYSWTDMANGRGDAWAADLSRQLATVGGPVWIAFHHEPEYATPLKDWIRMQQRLAPIVHANSNNIAYTVIYSAWSITYGQFPLSSVFPTGGGVDILGVDIYNQYSVRSTTMMDPMKFIPYFQSWADNHGIRWAIAESGYTRSAAGVDATWLDKMYNSAVANGAAAYSYFDSSRATDADWTLDDAVRLAAFQRILSTSTSIC